MYTKIKLSLFAIIFIIPIFFLGCTNNQPKHTIYPKWYTNQQNDTASTLYAKSEAYTQEEAISSALNIIASKINISIESSFKSVTNSSKNSYSKNTQQNIKNSVKKIDFTNYQVVTKERLSNDKIIVLVKIDKNILSKSLQLKIENDIKKYNAILFYKYSNITSKIKTYKQTALEIKESESSVYLLENLDTLSSTELYLTKLNALINKIDTFNNGITFRLSSNNLGKDFEEVLSSLITQKGFSITTYNPDIDLKLFISKKDISVLDYKVSKVVVNITAKEKTSLIGQKNITVGGKSISSFNQANQFAVKNFRNKLIKEDILKKLLGI